MNDRLSEARAVMREVGFADFPRPWIEETARRVAEDGAYADYAGWEAWFTGAMGVSGLTSAWWDEVNGLIRSTLYVMMTDACRMTAATLR